MFYRKGFNISGLILAMIVSLVIFGSIGSVIYGKTAASKDMCKLTGSLRSTTDKIGIASVTPDVSLACKTIDYGELKRLDTNDEQKVKDNYMMQISDMMYDCASSFNFGQGNVYNGETTYGPSNTWKTHCTPCYSFYISKDPKNQNSIKITRDEFDKYIKSYKIGVTDKGKQSVFNLLVPILYPWKSNDAKQYFMQDHLLKTTLPVLGETYFQLVPLDHLEEDKDYSVIFMAYVEDKISRRDVISVSDFARHVFIIETKDFAKFRCDVKND